MLGNAQGSSLLNRIQKEFPGYHPVVSIARIAHDPDASLSLQFSAHMAVAKYVEPELKSIEVRSLNSDGPKVTVSLFEEAQIVNDPLEALPALEAA